ncbi:hypothetical protein IPG41_05080 [Candidatus Peregrinibacteria bacterium]|nr:MAG: hypothetical protein IPG41_05080 [Candidatus Peregrinibacteria bacterium]
MEGIPERQEDAKQDGALSQLYLPSIPNYLSATVVHLLDPFAKGIPADDVLGMGQVLGPTLITRMKIEELGIYLQNALNIGPSDLQPKIKSVADLLRKIRNPYFEQRGGNFVVNTRELPEFTEEDVKTVVRRAGLTWLRDQFQERVAASVADIHEEIPLRRAEQAILEKLLIAGGKKVKFQNLENPDHDLDEILTNLRRKLDTHFGIKTLPASAKSVKADDSLLELLDIPSLGEISSDHRIAFGDELPVPALILAEKMPFDRNVGVPRNGRKQVDYISLTERADAIDAILHHLLSLRNLGIDSLSGTIRALKSGQRFLRPKEVSPLQSVTQSVDVVRPALPTVVVVRRNAANNAAK